MVTDADGRCRSAARLGPVAARISPTPASWDWPSCWPAGHPGPDDLDVHLILDNYATHKTPDIKRWLLAHPRFHLHFTPTSASWLNLVERWFAELTQKKLKRGVHHSVQALERDIPSWLADWNQHPRPFVWTSGPANDLRDSPESER